MSKCILCKRESEKSGGHSCEDQENTFCSDCVGCFQENAVNLCVSCEKEFGNKSRRFPRENLSRESSTLSVDDNFEKVLQLLDSSKNVLLHGPGGTGKTYFLKKLARHLSNNGKIIAVTATTGVAALNLVNPGYKIHTSTLHSWAGIGIGKQKEKLLAKVLSRIGYIKRWKSIEYLFIDEVSMMGKTLFDNLDYVAKRVRGNDDSFGGITLILSGDFYQLPPVKDDWLFESKNYKACNFNPIIFRECKRFDNKEYFELLNRVRMEEQTQEDVDALRSKVKAYDEYTRRNKKNKEKIIIKPTILYSKKVDVLFHNIKELEKLPGSETLYFAQDEYIKFTDSYSKPYYEKNLDDSITSCVRLKPGSQVMLKKNLSVEEGYVNGSRGVIKYCDDDFVEVLFMNGRYLRVGFEKWEFEDANGYACRAQIPFILAWSSTIHKIQGSTIDYVICDLGTSIFAHGQAYVALSRVRNFKGLFISKMFAKSLKKVDKKVVKYVNTIEYRDGKANKNTKNKNDCYKILNRVLSTVRTVSRNITMFDPSYIEKDVNTLVYGFSKFFSCDDYLTLFECLTKIKDSYKITLNELLRGEQTSENMSQLRKIRDRLLETKPTLNKMITKVENIGLILKERGGVSCDLSSELSSESEESSETEDSISTDFDFSTSNEDSDVIYELKFID